MPRFSAHVGYLFPDRPLLERFDAVAKAGFKAVDMPVCYEVPAAALRDAVKRNGLTPLGINTPKHDDGGSHSLGAVPGREKDWEALFDLAMEYATTIGNSAIHCMSGIVAEDQRAAAEGNFVGNLAPRGGVADA